MKNKPFLFILNPEAGNRNSNVKKAVEDFLQKEERGEIIETKKSGHGEEAAKEAQKKEFIPVAVGGDGTVNEVARATAGTGYSFGIIPAGSGNGLARHFGIPTETNFALRVLKRRKIKKSDSGRINDKFFLMTTGVGFDSQVTKKMSERERRGLAAYIDIILKTWKERENLPVSFEVNGKKYEREVFIFSASNTSQYGNGVYIAPDADNNDGLLDINIIKPFPCSAIPSITLRATGLKTFAARYVENFKTPEVILSSERKEMNIDGESKLVKMPVSIKAIKDDLEVIC
jgi:YegS/Rv2252/BmrU family lipid kinase